MRFRVGGIPVEVELGFWLSAALSQFHLIRDGEYRKLIIWLAVAFVSVLLHELGHAAAIKRHRIAPAITLHWMGGTTAFRPVLPLGRLGHVGIAVAGPLTGLAAAGVVYGAMHTLLRFRPDLLTTTPELAIFAVDRLVYANLCWGLFNLIPALPLDGGHALEHALGPARAPLAARLSFLVACLGAGAFALDRNVYPAFLLALAAIHSFLRVYGESDREDRPRGEEPLPGELQALLVRARHALEAEQLVEAARLAVDILKRDPAPPRRAAREAHEIVAWAALHSGYTEDALVAVAAARRLGEPDPALLGVVHRALGDAAQARRVLERARAAGDSRKEVAGPLIQILIEQGEVARAAAIALEIVDSLSEEDARRMAEIALEVGEVDTAAQLCEAVARRHGSP